MDTEISGKNDVKKQTETKNAKSDEVRNTELADNDVEAKKAKTHKCVDREDTYHQNSSSNN